ncbi:MAG: nitrous oxide reductase family maturation protein NosD, partial [Phototrophicales bacterium]
VHDSKRFRITNNTMRSVFFGIKVDHSSEGWIEGNHVQSENKTEAGAGNGIHLWHCEQITLRRNDLSKMRDGIYFEFVKNSHIENNVSHNNIRYGLHFMFSNHDSYTNNHFYENGAGVAVM